MTQNDDQSKYHVPNLDRALSMLELLSDSPEGLAKSEIVSQLSLSTNIVYRISMTLANRGYIYRDQKTKRFHLDPKMMDLCRASLDEHSLTAQSFDILKKLRDKTKETVHLSIISDHQGIVLERLLGKYPVSVLIEQGLKYELHAGAPGKAMLAYLPEDEMNEIINKMSFTQYNENTITDRNKFLEVLRKVRADGFALDHSETFMGIDCIAAPIFDSKAKVVASICITGPKDRIQQNLFDILAEEIKKHANEISFILGFLPDPLQ